MDRGAWQTTVSRVSKSQTQLSEHTHTHTHAHTQVNMISPFRSKFRQVVVVFQLLSYVASLQPHGLQHTRLPSSTTSVCSNSYPWDPWGYLTILLFVTPFFFYLLYFPASGSFPLSQFFKSGGQSIGASASASFLPMNTQGWFPFRTDWFDVLTVHRTVKSLPQHHSSKAPILRCSAFFMVQLSHLYMTTRKIIALTIWTFVDKVMSLLF